MRTCDQPALGWTTVLRRQPVHIVAGRVDGGYTNLFELTCCDCGDHPDLDYGDVSPRLQRIREPYPIAAGIAAYGENVKLYHKRFPARWSWGHAAGLRTDADDCPVVNLL